MARRHSAAGCPIPGVNCIQTAEPTRIRDEIRTRTWTSRMSASPAATIPSRNTTSRPTKNAEKIRPRISRGVFRCMRSRRAIDEGALRNPERVTSRIATTIRPAWPRPANSVGLSA
jgi:hypothetical protein